jgi:Fe-S-cluster containining protein
MKHRPLTNWVPQRYFFDRGLRFECVQCGRCCTGDPGIVYVAPEELAPLAAHLEISLEATIRRYLAPWGDGHTIREAPDGSCLFYHRGCTIYPVRPTQCRTWPFWMQNLRTPARWEQVARSCPGIGRGRRYTREEILTLLSDP